MIVGCVTVLAMIVIAGGAVIVCIVVIATGMFCLHKYISTFFDCIDVLISMIGQRQDKIYCEIHSNQFLLNKMT